MPMYACAKCGENRWKFKKIESWIRATCEFCDNEVEFEAKPDHQPVQEGDYCRKEDGGIIITKPVKKKDSIYSAYYFCPVCRTIYFSPDFLK
jgi:transcription elongation factor Elf1